MNNKTQSSVEWFAEKLKSQALLIGEPDNLVAFEQAKAMHKQELLNIFNCGRNFQATGEGTFNEIYNEIYGS